MGARETLENELYAELQKIHDLAHGETAEASIEHATLMIRVWSLRFQLSNIDYDEVIPEETASQTASRKHATRTAMKEASRELVEWEKRKSVALADLANHLLIAAAKHEAEQAQLASDLDAIDE